MIGVQTLFSLLLLRNFSSMNPLSVCNTLEDFGKGVVEDFGKGVVEDFLPFSISLWVFSFTFLPILLVQIVLFVVVYLFSCLECMFSVVGRVPEIELYARFWDVLRPGGVPTGFEKLLSLGFWSSYRLARRSSS